MRSHQLGYPEVSRNIVIAVFAGAVLLSACDDNGGKYMEVVGGGFLFNYRIAVATAGLVVVPTRELPEGASVEVTFENPAGGAPIVMIQDASNRKVQLNFNTPPLFGIVADKKYVVRIRLVAADGSEIERIDKNFHSALDQSVLPPKPLTVGPGYIRNPDLDPKDAHGHL
jgi:hypothetical protein